MRRVHFSSSFLLDGRLTPTPGITRSRSASEQGHRARGVVGRRIRAVALTALLLALWIALLGWAAEAPSSVTLQPAQRMRYAGSDFHVVMGAAVEDGRRLGVNAVGTEQMALQSVSLAHPIDARAFPVLRYRWQDFPRTLELSFVFRRADQPADVHTVTLPPAGRYPAYFDLSDSPEWRGDIVEIGFAEFPTAQLVPADIAFRPFSFVEAELWSPSWRGSFGALGTDWSAYRPWALMSVSALGPDAPWPHKPTPVLVLTIGLAASLAIAAVVLARSGRWLGMALLVALAVGWLALDLRWLAELADRHALTRELYAGKTWRERAAIEPDTALVAAASRVRDLLAREPANTHVIVASSAVYDVLRLAYHLLPANVAPAGALLGRSTLAGRPTLLVVYADPDWTFDAEHGRLQGAGAAYRAAAIFEDSDVRVFELRGAAP